MPQLSLYIDEETLRKIEAGAKNSHVSISKFVVNTLNAQLEGHWPEGYFNLFGCIKDDDFSIEGDSGFEAEREGL